MDISRIGPAYDGSKDPLDHIESFKIDAIVEDPR